MLRSEPQQKHNQAVPKKGPFFLQETGFTNMGPCNIYIYIYRCMYIYIYIYTHLHVQFICFILPNRLMWNRGVELEGRIITVTLGNNRFCWCKGASHRSNHVYLVADLLRGDFYQILCLENTTERNSDKVLTTSLRSRIDTSIKIFENP